MNGPDRAGGVDGPGTKSGTLASDVFWNSHADQLSSEWPRTRKLLAEVHQQVICFGLYILEELFHDKAYKRDSTIRGEAPALDT